jgi:hypothetical protein
MKHSVSKSTHKNYLKKNYFLYYKILLFIIFILFSNSIYSQNKIPSTFMGTSLINMPSTRPVDADNLEIRFNHRFGSTKKGISDLFGLDEGANVAISMDYGITNKFSLGLARISSLKTYELRTKYAILTQTNSLPFSISFHGAIGTETEAQKIILGNYLTTVNSTGNIIGDAYLKKLNYREVDLTYKDRTSYLASFLISKRINDIFSIQLSPMYVHRNFVKSNLSNDRMGISIAGRVKITKTIDFTFEIFQMPKRDYIGTNYDTVDNTNADNIQMINGSTINSSYSDPNGLLYAYYNNVYRDKSVPHLYTPISLGFDFEAGGHVFQIFLSNNKTMAHTQYLRGADYDIYKKDILLGFNLSRVFSFESTKDLE